MYSQNLSISNYGASSLFPFPFLYFLLIFKQVLDTTMAPKEVHVLTLRFCKYVTLPSKMNFASAKKVKDLEIERLFGVCGASRNHKGPQGKKAAGELESQEPMCQQKQRLECCDHKPRMRAAPRS